MKKQNQMIHKLLLLHWLNILKQMYSYICGSQRLFKVLLDLA